MSDSGYSSTGGAVNPTTSPTSSASSRTWAVNPDPTRSHNGKKFGKQTAILAAEASEDYLAADRLPKLKDLPPKMVSNGLLDEINRRILTQNRAVLGYKDADGSRVEPTMSGTKLGTLGKLPFPQVASLMVALHSVILLSPSSRNSDPDLNILAAYDDDPTSDSYGTYRTSQNHIRTIARRYQPDLTTKEFTEVLAALTDMAPLRTRGQNEDLLACNNGIVDYNAGNPKLMDFSPEYVFVSKMAVDFDPDATNPIIPNPEGCCQGHDDPSLCSDTCLTWDVESWMAELSDDEGVPELLWEVIGAATRPYVSWNQCAFFYGTKGNNGKGTLLSLMRNLLGVQNYANIPLTDFAKDFLLEPLTRASAILVDENDVGAFLEKSANFKAVVTNDVITINRKYKAPIAHQHWGFMVQCMNDRPSIKDKSESFYRRQVFIPFTKSFTGAERKYIKDDYLARPEVLQYVLKRVLTMNYYSLSQPQAVVEALEDFKNHNDPIRAFWAEMRAEFVWDLLPWSFLYQAYCGWMEKFMRNSKPIGRNKFIEALTELVQAQPNGWWDASDPKKPHRIGSRMDRSEPIIATYKLEDWCDPTVADPRKQPVKYSTFPPSRQASAYRGLLRRDPADMAGYAEAEAEPQETAPARAELAAQAGITVTPPQSGQAEAPKPAVDPFAPKRAPGWGDEGITPPVDTSDPQASHPNPVDPRPGDAAGSTTEGDSR